MERTKYPVQSVPLHGWHRAGKVSWSPVKVTGRCPSPWQGDGAKPSPVMSRSQRSRYPQAPPECPQGWFHLLARGSHPSLGDDGTNTPPVGWRGRGGSQATAAGVTPQSCCCSSFVPRSQRTFIWHRKLKCPEGTAGSGGGQTGSEGPPHTHGKGPLHGVGTGWHQEQWGHPIPRRCGLAGG